MLTGTPFPKTFPSTCKKILTRLHRIFVHVYIHHFDRIHVRHASLKYPLLRRDTLFYFEPVLAWIQLAEFINSAICVNF